MDGSAKVSFLWADGNYDFRLPVGQIRELQDKTNAGPLELHRRITGGTWRIDDLAETIRLGLIGGGMKPPEAFKLVDRYVYQRPLTESVIPAATIIFHAIMGPEDDQPGKDKAAQDATAKSEQTESSPSPPSMETAQPSG